jgi:large subunit ribosomal protein L9
MEVILLEKIENLGELGDKVNVRPGFARNYLVPKAKAKYATEENLKEFEAKREELEKIAKDNLDIDIKRKGKLDGFTINIAAEANEEGLLFGSIGPYEVEKELIANGHEIERKEIRMPEGAIKKIGEYSISLHLGIDTDAIINLIVETNNQS